MFTTQQVADMLGISKRAVQQAIKRGKLTAERFGRDHMISQEAVDTYRETYLRKPGRK